MTRDSPRYGVEISDAEGGFLVVDLRKIIDALGNSLATLRWRLLSLWAVGELPGPRCVADYEELAGASATGLEVDWDELQLLADNTDQIIEAVFVGQRRPFLPEQALSSAALLGEADIVIEAIDGCLWRVVSRDFGDVERLRLSFNEVADVPESELLE